MQVAAPIAIGALVSGAGRSVLNLNAAIARGTLVARLAVVIGTRADLPALQKCAALGVRTAVVTPEPAETFDDRLDAELAAHHTELVCLCGYLRHFRVAAWRGRAVNIHPALLPEFGGTGMYGLRVHQAVLQSGCTESGCTAHWVDELYDHGPTLLQVRCPILAGDSPESLADRVFHLECTAYPQAIGLAAAHIRARGADAAHGVQASP